LKKKTLLSWSSGKDSAWSLFRLQRDPQIDLVGIFSVMNERYDRVSMHATRRDLLVQQAAAAGLPLRTISLPDQCTMEQCNDIMKQFVAACAADGIEAMAFGDLFLEDIRSYREKQLQGTGIEPLFPLWGIPTRQLAGEMLSGGLKAYISSVDLRKLRVSMAGRRWSTELLAELPEGSDPCGENGEMHTIAVAGPMFQRPIAVSVGETLERDGFAYADIIPID
jgi:uncharacterized protein (TIGR00290 family)